MMICYSKNNSDYYQEDICAAKYFVEAGIQHNVQKNCIY